MNVSRGLRFVDLSGYAFTGKAAVIDLMREIEGCSVPSSEFEFALLRCNGGLIDLEHALVDAWSPVRSSEAIRAFLRLIHVYGGDRGLAARLTRHGHHYDCAFPGFTERSLAFIDSLVEFKWRGYWPFAAHAYTPLRLLTQKVVGRLGFGEMFYEVIYLSAPSREQFSDLSSSYLQDVLGGAAREGQDLVVTHNAFEPFDPTRSLRFFRDGRAIVVDRDPRDVYVSAMRYVGRMGRRGWPTATTGGAAGFARRVQIERSRVRLERDDDRVLRMRFEDLVVDYESTVARILGFVGRDSSAHIQRGRYFDPGVSRAGVGAWKSYPDREAIRIIENRLPDLCFQT